MSIEVYLLISFCLIFIIMVLKRNRVFDRRTLFLYFIFISFKLVKRLVDNLQIQPMFIFPSLPTAVFSSMYVELEYNEKHQKIYFVLVLVGAFFDFFFSDYIPLVSHLNLHYLIIFVKVGDKLLPVSGFISSLVFYEDYQIIQILLAFIFFLKTDKHEKKDEESLLPVTKPKEEEEDPRKEIKKPNEEPSDQPKADDNFRIIKKKKKRGRTITPSWQ